MLLFASIGIIYITNIIITYLRYATEIGNYNATTSMDKLFCTDYGSL